MTAREILARLVAFPVLGGQSNLEIIHYIAGYLREQGVEATLVPNDDGSKASLHCRIGPAVEGGVILSGHTDVVPVAGQPWDTDPWELTERGGKLYGRGSCDMKGFLACCLANVPYMQQAALKKPIYFAFSYDEEIGCLAAPALVEAIKAHYPERAAYAVIGEPSLLQPVLGQKGITTLRTTITGSQGHSSRIRSEVSPIHVAARLISWLEDKMDRLVAEGRLDDRFDPNHSSLHVGVIRGGIAPNVIARDCSFDWDLRVIPMDKTETIISEYEAHCRELEAKLQKKYAGAAIETSFIHPPVPPLDTPEDLPIADWIKRLSGENEPATVAYAAEAGQFAEGGFPSVICGPGSIAQAHRANEFISIDQLEKGVDLIRRITNWCTEE